jgi:tetratricopeptide (TPR) repeat protein
MLVASALAVGFLVTLFTLCSLLAWVPVEEDAYISMRYAHNLASGHGLAFNATGPRTEGYTNLLWVLILALADLTGWDQPHAAKILGWIAGCVCIGFGWAASRRVARRHAGLALMVMALLATQPQFVFWSQRGLETGLLMALQVGMLLRFDVERRRPRARPWSALLAALTVMTRPDSVVIAAVVLGGHALIALRRRKSRRRSLIALGMFAGLLAALAAFKLIHYGDLLPNSYHFKTDRPLAERMARGHEQVMAFYEQAPLLFWALGAVPLLWPRPRRFAIVWIFWLGGLAVIATTYLTGGDDPWRDPHRFLTPLAPLSLTVLAGALHVGLHRWQSSRSWLVWRSFSGALGVALMVQALLPLCSVQHWTGQYRVNRVLARPALIPEMWRVWWSRPRSLHEITAQHLHRDIGPHSSIALNHVGRIPYFTGYHTYDTLGLCSAEILEIRRGSWEETVDHVADQEVELIAHARWELINLIYQRRLHREYEILATINDWIFLRRRSRPDSTARSFAVRGGVFDGQLPWNRVALARRLEQVRDREGEESWLRAVPEFLQLFPADVPTLRSFSLQLARAGREEQALRLFERGEEILRVQSSEQPFNAGYLIVLGEWAANLADHVTDLQLSPRLTRVAHEVATRALLRDPLSPATVRRSEAILGRTRVQALDAAQRLLLSGDWQGALETGRLAVALDAENGEAHGVHALAAYRLGRVDEAREAWAKAVSLVKGDRAENLWRVGFEHLGQMMITPAEALDRGDASAWQCHLVARWLERQGRWRDALKSWDQALRVGEPHAEYHLGRHRCLMVLHRPERALAAAQAAVDISPDHGWAHLYLGNGLERLGRLEEARQEWKVCLQSSVDGGSHARARANLNRISPQ